MLRDIHTRKLPVIVGAAALLLLGAGCSWWQSANTNQSTNGNGNVNVTGIEDDNENLNVNGNENLNKNVNENDNQNSNENENRNNNNNSNSDEDDDAVSSAGGLVLEKPEPNDEIKSPFEVRGESSASMVHVRIKSLKGTTFFTVPVSVRNGEFRVNLTFEFTNTTDGYVEVYEKDATDREANLVSAKVKFRVETDEPDDSNSNSNTNHD